MHILYLHQYFATPRGQTGTRSYEFARRWVAAGHRVTMLTSVAQLTDVDLFGSTGHLARRVTIDGIDVVALNVPYRHSMGFGRRVWSFVWFMMLAVWYVTAWRGVDVVYASSTPLTIGVPAVIARVLRGRRFVFEVRDPWPTVPIEMGIIRNGLLIGVLRALERMIYRWADAVVTLSPGMSDLVGAVAPSGKSVTTIPNCADIDLFRADVDGGAERAARGWDDRFVCLHTGAMGRANGLEVVVRAAERFRDDPRFLFVLMGAGGERRKLEAMRDRLGLSNLQIVDGVPKARLPAVLAAADACLMTVTGVRALEHNSANKYFDYLSAGRPVVMNYGGWKREVLERAEAGLGCDMGDEQQFFHHLATLCDDPQRRAEMGRNGRRLAVTRFDRDRLAAEALQVILASSSR